MNIHVSARTERREPSSVDPAFARDAISGLSQYPKKISPKYFYDEIGSHLFERITLLPEYYPTRTELRILREHGTDIADSIPENAALVEFGAGATTKVRLLLETCEFRWTFRAISSRSKPGYSARITRNSRSIP